MRQATPLAVGLAGLCISTLAAGPAQAAPSHGEAARSGLQRPGAWEACRAWRSHIGDLIDRHRIAHEIDDEELWSIIWRFHEAQTDCSAQRFEEAFRNYETIPIRQVRQGPLR